MLHHYLIHYQFGTKNQIGNTFSKYPFTDKLWVSIVIESSEPVTIYLLKTKLEGEIIKESKYYRDMTDFEITQIYHII
jgi:hypothetical protein